MEILQNLTNFVISTLFSKRRGAGAALFLWKGCQLRKCFRTYATEEWARKIEM